jgi:glycosyl-4,4'-diaponeurosporenoate acyltransferase
MWLELPNFWIVVLNALGIPAIHLGLSWWFTKLDRARFDPDSWLYRERPWEARGRIYQTLFHIRRWKHLLPDAAPWFDGFAKGKLADKDPAYLRAFIAETCRGEAAHYAQIPGILFTLIWNPWPVAAIVMIVYAVLSNLPCLILQRFTRARLREFLAAVADGPGKGSGA